LITRLSLVSILVPDQEEALQWFTEILGLKKIQDATYGKGARWLVVAPPDQADFGIVLQKLEPGLHGEEPARAVMEEIGKGTTRSSALTT
jgi:catechol 2,3-dioxygenase-like lactoylglutathione lyase family enzyme